MSWRQSVEAAFVRHDMLRFGRRIGVAVSGGADSVFLLHALRELGLAAAVLHVNHGLRGAESDLDEAFVRGLAEHFSLPFRSAGLPPGEGNIEQEARRARYRFFADCVGSGQCDAVATGHTLDDQAETVFTRLLRGAATAGLSGVRPVTDRRVIRPLLNLTRAGIRASLAERGIAWREDRSNADTGLLRNRVRLEIMPHLLELNPSLPQVLAGMSDWARGEEEFWAAEIKRLEAALLLRAGEAILLNTMDLANLPVASARRLLRRAVELVRGSLLTIDFRHVEAIRVLALSREGSGRIQIPGLDIYRSFDWLRFAPVGYDSRLPRDFEIELRAPGTTTLPERLLTIEMELVSRQNVYNDQMEMVDWDRVDASNRGPLVLRNWRPGDSYRTDGSGGVEKIKTMFQQHRVPLWERRSWPVIAQGLSVVWARRFGVADEFAVRPGSKRLMTIRETQLRNQGIKPAEEGV